MSPQPAPAHAVPTHRVAVVGAGPAGLMAADVLSRAGCAVDVFDAMPSAGRKFLLAGKGGLNLTHSEALEPFTARYGERRADVAVWLAAFGPPQVRAWALELGVPTFIGSSGRVFPRDLKAAPLLRAWLHRLRAAGVRFHMRHRWVGWCDGTPGTGTPLDSKGMPPPDGRPSDAEADPPGAPQRRHLQPCLRMLSPAGDLTVAADAVLLALGGASWSRLGSDGAWVPWLAQRGAAVEALQPSNCGFDVAPSAARAAGVATGNAGARAAEAATGNAGAVTAEAASADPVIGPVSAASGWTEHFHSRFAGQPLKTVVLSFVATSGARFQAPGEFVVTATGIEGSLVYAASPLLREHIAAHGAATVHIDLLPGRSGDVVRDEVARPRGSRSMSTHLKSRLGLDGVKAALLHELLPRSVFTDPQALATAIKALPLTLAAPRPVDEAISTAGGVRLESLDDGLMLRACAGVFCAGEMLDWEAPTGGYLLTACLASGFVAGQGVLRHLGLRPPVSSPAAPAGFATGDGAASPVRAGSTLTARSPPAPG